MADLWSTIKDIGGSFLGTTQATTSRRAGRMLAEGTEEARQPIIEAYGQGRQDLMPWMTGGAQAGQTLGGLLAPGGGGQFQGTPGQFSFGAQDFQQDPGYQFRQAEAQKAIERSAAGAGGLSSGATLDELMQRSQNIAGQEYGNAFNRSLQGYGANLQRAGMEQGAQQDYLRNLFGVSEQGRGTANTLAGMGQQYGGDIADLIMGKQRALAGGELGAGQAYSGGLQNIFKLLEQSGKAAGAAGAAGG